MTDQPMPRRSARSPGSCISTSDHEASPLPSSLRRMKFLRLALALLLFAVAPLARGDDLAALCADRAAIERVYHSHRLETRQTFEEAMPAALLERLVRLDVQKEERLRSVYGVTITSAEIEAEVRRIEATTRAPETLAELKAALGGDPARFARTVARPIVVERALRARFENDDKLHAERRREAEAARAAALGAQKEGVGKQVAALTAAKAAGSVADATWQLGARPSEDAKPEPTAPPPATKGTASSGSYSIEATAKFAQVLGPPPGAEGSAPAGTDRKFYFGDLDPELQKVLRAQLSKPGDVSAVIETPGGFLVFVAKEKTADILRAASFSLPKRSYEEWLAEK